jgi:hypothetical protein
VRGNALTTLKPNERFIWVLKNGRPQREVVAIGITDGSQTEITSGGVRDGDRAVIEALGAPPATTVRPF